MHIMPVDLPESESISGAEINHKRLHKTRLSLVKSSDQLNFLLFIFSNQLSRICIKA